MGLGACWLGVLFALWIGLVPALAEKRVALVIGNSDYVDVPPLANPRNDAADIGKVLERLGFETIVVLDADREALIKATEDFGAKIDGADVALFYYAGHAMQHQGVNYLMPTDASLRSAAGLRRMTKLNDVISDVRRAKAMRILIIDACRDNPMVEKLDQPAAGANPQVASRSAGLAKVSTRSMAGAGASDQPQNRGGDIVVYAAEAGRTASDGAGRNSPFSGALLRHIDTEGQEIVSLMRRVTTAVQQETNGEQRPELSIAVPFEFYFKPGPPQPPPTIQQLLPKAKSHEVAEIQSAIDAIVNRAPEQQREQVRRELMVMVSNIAERSGLRPDQIVNELPRAYQLLAQTRKEIEEFRRLMESEPEIAPFIELAAAAVASGRRQDTRAAAEALAQARARYNEAIRVRAEGLERARANRAAVAEQEGRIADIEYRSKDAAAHYLAAAEDTPPSDLESAARRYAMAGGALYLNGDRFFANDDLRESIRLLSQEALPRFERVKSANEDERLANGARIAITLANLADAQTKLGGRTPGIDGARMMVDARQTYGKALATIKVEDYTSIFMDILDRRAQRDIEFGRRIPTDRGRRHFEEAAKATRVILSIQSKYDSYKEELGRTRNNLAYILMGLSRRTDGDDGDKQIDEAIGLLQDSLRVLETQPDKININIARTNLAYSLMLRAERRPGMERASDLMQARDFFRLVNSEVTRDTHPRLWATLKRWEAEYLRLLGEREKDPSRSFASLKSSFEMFQGTLAVISRETAPNDWALVCAEMGYTIVAALPLLDENNRKQFARNAVGLFRNARTIFASGGFYQDIAKLDVANKTAVEATGEDAAPKSAPSRN